MNELEPEPELSRPVATDRIPMTGMQVVVQATQNECQAVAQRLGLVTLEALTCHFTLTRPLAGASKKREGEIVAEGHLKAILSRDCVITLDPFEIPVDERFRVRFVPAGSEFDDEDPESDDEIPYQGAGIDLGEAAVEQLALTLDPYPKKPGAKLPDDANDGPENPFAVLAGRRR